MVFRTCQQVEGGLPNGVQAMMLFNIILDFGLGLCPFIGDLADAVFRANTRNAVELEKFLRDKGAKNLRMSGVPLPQIDPSDPDHFDEQVRHEDGPPPQYTTSSTTRQGTQMQQGGTEHAQSPRTAPVPEKQRGWFGGSKKKQPDLEQGQRREDTTLPSVPNNDSRRIQKERR